MQILWSPEVLGLANQCWHLSDVVQTSDIQPSQLHFKGLGLHGQSNAIVIREEDMDLGIFTVGCLI